MKNTKFIKNKYINFVKMDIGFLYLIFGGIAGVIGMIFSLSIRLELIFPGMAIPVNYSFFYVYFILVVFFCSFFVKKILYITKKGLTFKNILLVLILLICLLIKFFFAPEVHAESSDSVESTDKSNETNKSVHDLLVAFDLYLVMATFLFLIVNLTNINMGNDISGSDLTNTISSVSTVVVNPSNPLPNVLGHMTPPSNSIGFNPAFYYVHNNIGNYKALEFYILSLDKIARYKFILTFPLTVAHAELYMYGEIIKTLKELLDLSLKHGIDPNLFLSLPSYRKLELIMRSVYDPTCLHLLKIYYGVFSQNYIKNSNLFNVLMFVRPFDGSYVISTELFNIVQKRSIYLDMGANMQIYFNTYLNSHYILRMDPYLFHEFIRIQQEIINLYNQINMDYYHPSRP